MGRIVQSGLTKKYMTDELDKVAKANAGSLVSLSEKRPLAFEQILGPILLTLVLQAACFMVLLLGNSFNVQKLLRIQVSISNFRIMLEKV